MQTLPSRLLAASAAALFAFPAIAGAQARPTSSRDTVPLSMLPPAGKCRIWMTGVPAAQQPAPTDCATALRQRPTNGVVLYGISLRGANGEPFDPKVGSVAERQGTDGKEIGGSAAEQELRRRRADESRQRRTVEYQERVQKEQQDAVDRLNRASGASVRSSPNSAATKEAGSAASARAPSSGSGGSSASASRPPAEPKPPASDTKKKPE